MKHFGSLEAIVSAEIKDIASAGGISAALAAAVREKAATSYGMS
jgi:excinuclease UvrABC nuclease subunit